ncbi:MAG: flagellar hook-basal body complex protein FliE [Candidatus Eremiobacteraeota bacterium]|nr:flagellar hook-basal body complex protein FliE [Candidatus Eremiobacteraeota bacterium]MBV9700675.1 flagellar hook-basal body complex protein FliE [Candidatus Eremiobacteraeota bacterium]
MNVAPVSPDVAPVPDVAPIPDVAQERRPAGGDAGQFARALDALSQTLGGAARAEDAFAAGAGTLQQAVYERAQADVALAIATSSASRIVASVQAILNMQV